MASEPGTLLRTVQIVARTMILAARELAASHVTGYLNTITQRLHEGDLAQLDLTVTSSIVVHTDLADTLIRVAEDGEFVQDNAGLEDWM